MKSIRLAPVRHEQPYCLDYEDENEVRRFEIAMRIHRAHIEGYSVAPLDGRVDGAYRVTGKTGASGKAWIVDVVDRSGSHDACTCPDFLGNEIGTCKHLEAVRRAIARVSDLRHAFAKLKNEPRTATLAVTGVGGARLVEVGPWNARLRARLGIVRDARHSEAALSEAASLLPGYRDGVRVVHAAQQVAASYETRRSMVARRNVVENALRTGRLRFDMLAHRLFPYQERGAAHLAASGRALLADDMGLGKTIQAIAACELLRARGEAARVLIVTCASLKHQWQREIERFANERAVVVGGGRAQRRAMLENDEVYKIVNYELTRYELMQLKSLDADVVVYDEAQRAKNFRTKTAATLRSIPSRFTFVLTGTPVENRLDDLYALLQLVDPTLLGPLWKFNLSFARQNDRGRIVGYKNLSAFRERIAPVVLRRRKEDVLAELPPLTEQTRYTALTTEQAELEMGYRKTAAMLMQLAERRPLTKGEQDQLMMALLKARQACNAVELCDPKGRVKASPKLDELEALLGEILPQPSAKVLVFSEWLEMLNLAAKRLDRLKIGYAMLHGGVPTERRPALLDRFRAASDVRVLLSTEAGGVGLNLQVATYVVHLDLPWNPARLDQRTSRAHRMGQTRGVTVTYLCAEDGIERGIEGTLAIKRAIRGAALDSASTIDGMETPSFNARLQQVREILEALEEAGSDGEVELVVEEPSESDVAGPPATNLTNIATAAARIAGNNARPQRPSHVRETAAGRSSTPPDTAGIEAPVNGGGNRGASRAYERLRLARVVLAAGFPADSARAAYEALASAVTGLLDEPPEPGHAALVAAVYRELLPAGRLPAAAHATLAMLHDLCSLDAHGVAVEDDLATRAVNEAEQWLARLCPRVVTDTSTGDLATLGSLGSLA